MYYALNPSGLPQDIIDKLISEWEESDCYEEPAAEQVPNSQIEADVARLTQKFCLSKDGESTVQDILAHYTKHGDPNYVIAQYPKLCLNASALFACEAANPASKRLLDVLEEILSKSPTVEEEHIGKIDENENNTIEFLAGYTTQ
uniref:Uncharacterized protein LOC108950786 n=1 Tax=Phallusia mammillata TaxID=59560 RepID=A0A6F9DIT4_9ASCI|nr:uncharacterized protein LOC108950786 [Phallusia mammillata]